jgi:hypothetical protein
LISIGKNTKGGDSRRRVTTGKQAEGSIFKRSIDQLIGAGKARYGGKTGVANIARDLNSLRMMLNTENKHVDQIAIFQGVTNASPTNLFLTPSAEGTDSNNRTGRSVKLDRVDMLLRFNYNGGTTTSIATQTFRWFLVKWLKTPTSGANGGFPLSAFLLTDASGNYSPMSLANTDTAENFRIMAQGLEKMTMPLNFATVETIVEVSVPCQFHQSYDGTAATDICDGAIYFICLGMVANATGGSSGVTPTFRTWFIDN